MFVARPVVAADLPLMLAWRNHPDVRRMMFTTHEISEEEHHAWWERAKDDPRRRYFLVCEAETPVGVIGFVDIDPTQQTAAWIMYSGDVGRRGLGRQMELVALDYAFGPLGLRKLWGEGLETNHAVLKLHRRFGFRIEGTFRGHHRQEGKLLDVWRIGMTAEEWARTRPIVQSLLTRRVELDRTLAAEEVQAALTEDPSGSRLMRLAEATFDALLVALAGPGTTIVERRSSLRPQRPAAGPATARVAWLSTLGARTILVRTSLLDADARPIVEGEIEARPGSAALLGA